ncbi:MAG: LapA family protein, partial [Betaproteobacteria bacterium]
MHLRTVMLLLLALVLAVFVAVNWTAFMTPTVLSLIVTSVQAPLGLVMLVITGLLAALFLGYALYLQGSALLETRRMTRDLQSQRQLADQAEASRFTELRGTLETRLDQLATTLADDRTRHAAEMARFSD